MPSRCPNDTTPLLEPRCIWVLFRAAGSLVNRQLAGGTVAGAAALHVLSYLILTFPPPYEVDILFFFLVFFKIEV